MTIGSLFRAFQHFFRAFGISMSLRNSRRVWGNALRLTPLILLSCGTYTHGQAPAPSTTQPAAIAQVSSGTVSVNVYRNPDLGLRYEFPKGWVVNDEKTQRVTIADQTQFVWTQDISPRRSSKKGRQCTKALLFVTKYPAAMKTNDFNPFVFVIAADPQCITGPSSPRDIKDQETIERIAAQLGVYFETVSIKELKHPPAEVHAFENSGRVIIERDARYLVTYVTSDIPYAEVSTITKAIPCGKYWTIFMFGGADDAQLAWLKATKITFDSPTPNTEVGQYPAH